VAENNSNSEEDAGDVCSLLELSKILLFSRRVSTIEVETLSAVDLS
jgi:hypothetical protein